MAIETKKENKVFTCLKIVNQDSYYDSILETKNKDYLDQLLTEFNSAWIARRNVEVLFDLINNKLYFRRDFYDNTNIFKNNLIRNKMVVIGEIELNRLHKNQILKAYNSPRKFLTKELLVEFLKSKTFKDKLNNLLIEYSKKILLNNDKTESLIDYMKCRILKEDASIYQQIVKSAYCDELFDGNLSVSEIFNHIENMKAQNILSYWTEEVYSWFSKYYKSKIEIFDSEFIDFKNECMKNQPTTSSKYTEKITVNSFIRQIKKFNITINKDLLDKSTVSKEVKKELLTNITSHTFKYFEDELGSIDDLLSFLKEDFIFSYDNFIYKNRIYNYHFNLDIYYSDLIFLERNECINLMNSNQIPKILYVKQENYSKFKKVIKLFDLKEEDYINPKTELIILNEEEFEKIKDRIV